MALFLGIDGGGSGCRAALVDAGGRVLGQGMAGPANIASDLDGARRNILAAAEAALASSGRPVALEQVAAGLGLAGANALGAAQRLRAALPFRRLRIETDAVAAVKGALGDGDGIVAAIGTGSVFAAQRGGVFRQIGGWGLVLGDEGSGAWIGRAILSAALGAVDGFRERTPLLEQILDEHGGNRGIVAFSLTARPADFAALAPRVLAADDPAARDVMAEALARVGAAIAVLQGDPPLPVTCIGGLGAAYAARLSDRWAVVPPRGTALDGALILAREAA
jgi:glucosamine kinase